MKFLAISTNNGDPTPWIAAESERMMELAKAGTIETAFLKADFSGAVLIVEAADSDGASTELATLPLVTEGVTRFALTPIVGVPQPE